MLIKHIKRPQTIISPQKKVLMTKNARIGTLVAYRNKSTDEIMIGWSMANNSAGDKFDKKTGIAVAFHRAVALEDLYNNFSPKIIKVGLDLNKIDDEEVFVPVLGKIAAGAPIEALENQTESLPLSKNFLGSNEYFALKVEGDSMIDAGINTGDYVIIKKTNIAESGKIVVALIDDHEATLKRMRKKGPSIALESANPAYETKIYNTERVKIQGVLASLYRKF